MSKLFERETRWQAEVKHELRRIRKELGGMKLSLKKGEKLMAKVDEVLAKIKEVKDKVLALQQQQAAGGMTAEQEAQVEAALTDLSQTADPNQPNPEPQP